MGSETSPESSAEFPREYYRRYDETADEAFYAQPRKVVHIDDGAIAAASALYGELLPTNGAILDLMSAWRTHLPQSYKPASVTGLGMNADEMADNPQLTDYVVHNLNRNPVLPFPNARFDGAICTVSVQYLTDPVPVFTGVRRVLKPGSPFILTFSNRCFPTKAVAVWQATTMQQKAGLVSTYLEQAGFSNIRAEDRSPKPLRRGLFTQNTDPLIGVWGYA
jgi:SAM-dependent methyltransferase